MESRYFRKKGEEGGDVYRLICEAFKTTDSGSGLSGAIYVVQGRNQNHPTYYDRSRFFEIFTEIG